MKKHALTAGLVSLMFVVTACDWFDKVDDVNFQVILKENILVEEDATATNAEYDYTSVMEASDDAEVQKYLRKIKNFDVSSISFSIIGYDAPNATAPVAITDASIAFSAKSESTPSIVASIANVNLADAFASGEAIEVPLEDADFAQIEAWLESDKGVKVYANGTLSETPVTFEVNVMVKVKVKAEAL